MHRGAKGGIFFVIAVGAAAWAAYYFGGVEPSDDIASYVVSKEVKPEATDIRGDVLSIRTITTGNRPERKEVVVRLPSGKTVRAYVPPESAVFPGQVARLSRFGSEGARDSFYVLDEARERIVRPLTTSSSGP